jgi:hypothetical protein
VRSHLGRLAEFVAGCKVVVRPQMLRILAVDLGWRESLWTLPEVQRSLGEVEEACQGVVAGLAARLQNEQRTRGSLWRPWRGATLTFSSSAR